ncbi:dihydroxyacetone phosphate acyltransferase-like [Astatotilapia calliptera]|uniref:Phospholipid/glycerol acyltransferase domain-containing protein n=1 Tax=Astatotilapia calliptera TaxID=8154 RepID=A0AAX7UFA1_ASTCA|nr:dihydroxyacetone phosphate acyltransferase-like [Astatotilapia calliptera]
MTSTYKDSATASLKDEEEFTDILEERRRTTDFGYALRTFNPQPYKGAPTLSTSDLNKAVLESQYLCYIIKEIAMETGSSVEKVKEDASRILKEMSHNLQLGFIRLMGYTLNKVFKRLYRSIYVNMEGLNMLQQAIQESPVILIPNHRSYVDFLIISYILFTYDIPVPVIAAGIRLADVAIIGGLLRRSGAFYIRRAIGSDKLYWAVLLEYVQTIVRTGYAPLEFYVEGFRSRTLKSLVPKLGMMDMVLEPYFKGEVFDITLVPISISYDRVLEESLLALELLGVPRPKESITGLFKASGVLQEDYGCMHVNFGRPLSARQLCEGKINWSEYNLIPRNLPQRPTAETQDCVNWLAHLIVRTQEEGSLISPWSLMACLLLQTPFTTLTEEGLQWHQLTEKTLWLRKLVLDFGARLNWPAHIPDSEVMSSTVALHHSIVHHKEDRIYLVQDEDPARQDPLSPEEGVMRMAVVVLMLVSYRNQALHVFVRPGILATAIHITKNTRKDELFSFFCFLQDVFSNEFIFIPGRAVQDFEEACSLLQKCGAVHISQQEVIVLETGLEVLSFLQKLLQPFLDSYQLMFRYLCEKEDHVFTEEQFLPDVRNLATKLILSGDLRTFEVLSSDTQKNVLSALRRLEAVTKLRASQQKEYKVNKAAVSRTGDILSGKVPLESLHTTPDARLQCQVE